VREEEHAMKKLFKSKKGVALLATLAVAAAAAVGAYAYFSSSGHDGNATATVGQSTAFTFTLTAATGGPMYPGDTTPAATESATYKVNNPSTGHQQLNQVVVSVANSDGSAWSSGTTGFPTEDACDASDFQLSKDGTTWAAAGASVTDTTIAANLAGGASSATHTVYIRMVDSGDGQDNCQNLANVPLYYAAS
jgi:hypothetical protein